MFKFSVECLKSFLAVLVSLFDWFNSSLNVWISLSLSCIVFLYSCIMSSLSCIVCSLACICSAVSFNSLLCLCSIDSCIAWLCAFDSCIAFCSDCISSSYFSDMDGNEKENYTYGSGRKNRGRRNTSVHK